MRYLSNHVVTSLVPELLGKDAPSNETAEVERRALEKRRTFPRSVDPKSYYETNSGSIISTHSE